MNYYNCVLQFFLGLVYLSSVVGKICMKVMLPCTVHTVLHDLKKTATLKEIALSKDMLYCTVLPFIHQKIWCAMNIHVRIWTLYEAVCNNVLVGQGCGGLILTAVSDIYSTTYIYAGISWSPGLSIYHVMVMSPIEYSKALFILH